MGCNSSNERDVVDANQRVEPNESQPKAQQEAQVEQVKPAASSSSAAASAPAEQQQQKQAEQQQQKQQEKQVEEEESAEAEEELDSDIDDFTGFRRRINPKNIINADELGEDFGIETLDKKEMEEDDLFQTEENEGKVCFTAVKPWKGAIVEPTDAPANNPELPTQDLELEWAYGYRSADSRNNIAINSQGQIIYPTAGVVVKLDAQGRKQEFYTGHNDDVVSLSVNPADNNIIATGQVATIVDRRATNPHVCVWNSVTGEEWILKNAHKRAIRELAFSPSGKYLATLGDDNDMTLKIWDWKEKRQLASLGADMMPAKIFSIAWKNDSEFMTVGYKHLYFWSFEGGYLSKSRGIVRGGNFKKQTMITATYTSRGAAAVTCKDGDIYFFMDKRAVKAISAHKGAAISVCTFDDGLISGGKDGKVNVYDSRLTVVNTIEVDGGVSSLYAKGNRLAIGTTKGSLYEVQNFTTSSNAVCHVRGHFDGELWALDVHPTNPSRFVTAGEDNTIAVWDAALHAQVKSAPITKSPGKTRRRRMAGTTSSHPENACVRAVSFSPDGRHIAAGTNQGDLVVFDADSLSVIKEIDLNEYSKQRITSKKSGLWIQAVRYSPDGKTLAVANRGMTVVLVDVAGGYKVGGTLQAHNASVTHLDWSENSKHLQTNCRAYELLFHEVNQGNLSASKQETNASLLRDTKWQTQTCILGWPVQGIFDPSQDGTDINAVDRSPDGSLIAAADDFGYVHVWRFPCIDNSNSQRVKGGHSSHVMNVKFSPDQKYLFSAGGDDQTILQWRVTGQ